MLTLSEKLGYRSCYEGSHEYDISAEVVLEKIEEQELKHQMKAG
jgi:hypothetical protein